MKINVKELTSVIDIIKASLEGFDEINIKNKKINYYWDIPSDELYNPLKIPKSENLELGQLTDDWEELLRLKKEGVPPISYDLKRLSSILKAISDEGNIALF